MYKHDEDGETLVIHSVVVDDAYKRKGVGSDLLKFYIENMQQLSVEQLKINKILLLSKLKYLLFYINAGFTVNGVSSLSYGKVRNK
jgi:GNAT superfamily N-acetyltransferase